MHHMAAVACMWSGVATITASMFLPSLSSIWRKSRYLAALGKALKDSAARRSSTSQSAAMFSVGAAARRLVAPCPPEPIAAKLSFSFGDLYPADLSDAVAPSPKDGT